MDIFCSFKKAPSSEEIYLQLSAQCCYTIHDQEYDFDILWHTSHRSIIGRYKGILYNIPLQHPGTLQHIFARLQLTIHHAHVDWSHHLQGSNTAELLVQPIEHLAPIHIKLYADSS